MKVRSESKGRSCQVCETLYYMFFAYLLLVVVSKAPEIGFKGYNIQDGYSGSFM